MRRPPFICLSVLALFALPSWSLAQAAPPAALAEAQALYAKGDFAAAAAAFERAAAEGGGGIAMYNAGAVHARLGNNDEAVKWLRKADALGFIIYNLLSSDDDLTSLRTDPRFPELLALGESRAFPCKSNVDAQRMNFWVGEWDVRTLAGQPAGSSSVVSVSGGCAVYENWTDRAGTEGKSLTTWNAARGQHQQFWVAQRGGVTEYRSGEWKGGSMVFIGDGLPVNNAPSLIRMTFTPDGSDIVRQMFESSVDGGKTWTRNSDLYYHRRKK